MNWVETVVAIDLLDIEVSSVAISAVRLNRQVVGDKSIFRWPSLGYRGEQVQKRGTVSVVPFVDQLRAVKAKR